MVRIQRVRSIAALALFAISTACDQRQPIDPGNLPGAERLRVSITPERDSVRVGATLGLTATVVDGRGVTRVDQTVRWNSLTPNIASVDRVGLVTGIAAGTASVMAMVGSGAEARADTAIVLVQAGVAALSVAPEFAEIALGDSLRLEATVRSPNGEEVQGFSVLWSTSDQTVAAISNDGVVTSLSPGDATLIAMVNGITAKTLVRVLANPVYSITIEAANSGLYPGDTLALVATVRDWRGRMLPATNVRWSSSAANVAEVTVDGVVHALAKGAALIGAAVEGVRASAAVSVFAMPAAEVIVAAPSNSVTRGGRLKALATARDAAGNVLNETRVAWSSSNPAVAQVSADGTVTGLVVGSTSIHAIVDSKIGTLPISVIDAIPTTISILPAAAAISLGKTAQLAAEVRDQGGNVAPGPVVTWASANPSVATVTGNGLVTAIQTGTTDIVATAGTMSAQASITVIPMNIASVSVSPASSQIQIGGTQQLRATVMDAAGSQVSNAAIAWSSSNPAVVSVSALGIASGVTAGNATITATSSGTTGVANMIVSSPAPPPVRSVTVTFNNPSLLVGQTTQAMVVARDANGNTIAGRPALWSSNDATLASVSGTGLVTAIAGGSATISAAIDGVIGYATIVIAAPTSFPVHSVKLTLAPTTINAGQRATSSVVLRDSLGKILAGRSIAWSSSGPNVASVGIGGSITGIAPGTAVITATSEGKSGSASISVKTVSPAVATVTVTSIATSLTPGQSTQATATVRDSAGNVLIGQSVTWLSSNPGAATVSATGLVTGVAAGATTITATAGGQTGSVVISVANLATVSVKVPSSIDATGATDVTDALTAFFSTVPDNATIQFPSKAVYRVEGTLLFQNRNNLTFEGNGATIKATTTGAGVTPPSALKVLWPRKRSQFCFLGGANITIKDMIVRSSNPNAGPTNAAYVVALEAQHAFEFDGVSGVTLHNAQAYDLYGDFVYLDRWPQGAGGVWTNNVTVRNSHFERTGRQGISVVAARNVLIENNYVGQVGRTSLDLEPSTPNQGAEHVVVRRNTFGRAQHNLLSAHGAAGLLDDITLEGNTLIDHAIKIDVAAPVGSRRSRFRILNNTSDRGFGSPLALMKFTRIDSVEVRGNYQWLAPNQPTVGVRTVESCYVTVRGNQFINTPREADIQATTCR